MSILVLVILVLLLLSAVWAVLEPELLRAAIALGVTSVLLALLMFELSSPLAAVFELSVCAGLITVVFVSAISLTRILSRSEELLRTKGRMKRFIWLPVLLIIVAVFLTYNLPLVSLPELPAPALTDVREVLWNTRRFDLLGQVLVVLAGVFGVVVLFKEIFNKESNS
jgi:NADH-quinone oxidoreductase subunit J